MCVWFTILIACLSGSQPAEITLESFGVKGDGSDETALITKALAAANERHVPLRLMGKTYIFSPDHTVDISGIPEFRGSGRLDVSHTGAAAGNSAMKAVFQVSGKIRILQANIKKIEKDSNTIQLNRQLKLKEGDVLFLTSAEPLPNPKRPYYSKGQRLIVKSYDNATGMVTITEPFYYSIETACLWLNYEIPHFKVTGDIEFVTSPMNFITCFRIYYAHAQFGGRYKNFALTAIMYKSSAGKVEDMEAELVVDKNNGYSHCVEVADMSDVIITNCKMKGGRHVISGTAGGLWEKDNCGGSGHAGYPSKLVVDGGVYEGTTGVPDITPDIGTIDAHGVVERMEIRNCTIYGGINLGANQMIIENVIIYTKNKHAFNVGSDVAPGSEWGNYSLKNITIHTENNDPAVFLSKSDITGLSVQDMKIQGFGSSNTLMDFRRFAPRNVTVDGLKGNGLGQQEIIKVLKRTNFKIKNANLHDRSVRTF